MTTTRHRRAAHHERRIDPSAGFDDFYARYAGRVRGLALRVLAADPDRAEDVVQETLLRAYRHRLHAEAGRDAWPWLAAVAHNLAVDEVRVRRRSGEVRLDDAATWLRPAPANDPETVLRRRWRCEGVREALGTLTTRHRRVLEARHAEGLACGEIAAAEGLSVDSVKSTLVRARRAFRVYYDVIAQRRGLGVLVVLPHTARRIASTCRRLASSCQHLGSPLGAWPAALDATVGAVVVVGAVALYGASGADPRLPSAASATAAAVVADTTSPTVTGNPFAEPPPALPVTGTTGSATDDGPEPPPAESGGASVEPAVGVGQDETHRRAVVENELDADGDGAPEGEDHLSVGVRCPPVDAGLGAVTCPAPPAARIGAP